MRTYTPALNSTAIKSEIEIIVPDVFVTDTCAATVTALDYEDNQGQFGGYIFGTNVFADRAKAQEFVYDNNGQAYTINSVAVAFADVSESLDDRVFNVSILGQQMPPDFGAELAVSDDVLGRDIQLPAADDTNVAFTIFTFPEPVLVTTDTFYVSINLDDSYNLTERTIEGLIGVYSTRDGCGSGENVYELFELPNNEGLAWENMFVNWQGLNAEMLIEVTIENNPTTSVRARPLSEYGVQVTPNPVSEVARLTATELPAGPVTVSLRTLTGQLVAERTATALGDQFQIDLPTAELPGGIYLYSLATESGIASGRLVVRH